MQKFYYNNSKLKKLELIKAHNMDTCLKLLTSCIIICAIAIILATSWYMKNFAGNYEVLILNIQGWLLLFSCIHNIQLEKRLSCK